MQNNPPQIGIDFNKGRQAKVQWKQAVAKAADNVAFGDAVSGIINQQSAEQTTQEAQPIAQEQSSQETADSEPQPIGHGVFGNIYDQFRGKAKEAIAFLLGKKMAKLLEHCIIEKLVTLTSYGAQREQAIVMILALPS